METPWNEMTGTPPAFTCEVSSSLVMGAKVVVKPASELGSNEVPASESN